MLRWVFGGLIVAAVVVLVAAYYPNGSAPQTGPVEVVGGSLPTLILPALDGKNFDLRDLRGNDVLVNVWATWCGPCRREMPALQHLAQSMPGKLTVIAIDQGEDRSVVQQYVKQFGVRFPVYIDHDQRVGTALHLIGLPSSFFIDRKGIVRDAVDGEMTYQMMAAKAGALVAGG